MNIVKDNSDIDKEAYNINEHSDEDNTFVDLRARCRYSSDSSDENDKAPDVISSIYQSMSKIIEALNTDNLLLNQQINKIRKELEFVCKTLSHLKSNTEEMTNTYINEVDIINSHIKTIRFNELAELRKKIDGISSMQKHIVDTRNMLMQMLDTNMKIIKKEVSELRNNKHIIRSIVEEEIKEYFSKKELSK